MADTSLFSRLRRLFSTNVVVRNVGGKQLKVADTSRTQSYQKTNLVDRFQKIYTGVGLSGYSDSLLTKSMRLNLFKDYESMDSDAIISSALDIYADESTMKSEYGDVLDIKTDNDQISKILHNLFYDILNIEFNRITFIYMLSYIKTKLVQCIRNSIELLLLRVLRIF